MKNRKLQATIYDNNDNAIHVDGVFIPGMRGRREYGAPIEPDDPPEIEITHAEDDDGNEIELTEKQQDEAIETFR